jgi:signal peptidase II
MSRWGKRFWFGVTLPVLFGFDWCTKEAARSLPLGDEVSVLPGWLSWTHAENPYVAFSVPIPFAVIVLFGLVALVGLGVWAWRLPADARVQGVALGAIMAGAAGNLFDRLTDGTVTDMVRVYTTHPRLAPWLVDAFGTATWPIFNVADASLFCGVALSLLHSMFEREGEPSAE